MQQYRQSKGYSQKYANNNGFRNIEFFADNDNSGANFNRPDYLKLITMIKEAIICTFIVKDMSWLEEITCGYELYTEIVFPNTNIWFITIKNGVDSGNQHGSDFTPFLNIINEWYAKDTSKKILAVFKGKGESGKPLYTNPPFRYVKDPDDKHHWIIEETTANVVRKIFNLCVDGYGPSLIAGVLEKKSSCTFCLLQFNWYQLFGKSSW